MLGSTYKMRQSVRRPIKLPALISSQTGSYIAKTLTLDLSEHGAKLKIDQAVALPQHFQLLLSEQGSVQRICELVWRNATAAGVRFLDAKQLKALQRLYAKPAR